MLSQNYINDKYTLFLNFYTVLLIASAINY